MNKQYEFKIPKLECFENENNGTSRRKYREIFSYSCNRPRFLKEEINAKNPLNYKEKYW